MTLAAHLEPWSGRALRHIPNGSGFDVLDFRFAGRSAENRWNDRGDPTLYLAGDQGVLIAEWGRHFAVDRAPDLGHAAIERAVFQLDLAIDTVIDLRKPEVWLALSLENAPLCFIDRDVARATANFIRQTTPAQALIAPSIAFPDQPGRWIFVLFLEKLGSIDELVSSTTARGLLWMR